MIYLVVVSVLCIYCMCPLCDYLLGKLALVVSYRALVVSYILHISFYSDQTTLSKFVLVTLLVKRDNTFVSDFSRTV